MTEPVPDPAYDNFLSVGGNVIRCDNHRLVQHRDGRVPWCNRCRKTAHGLHKDDIQPFWDKKRLN